MNENLWTTEFYPNRKNCVENIVMKVTNKMQLYRLIYFSLSALHVSGDVFVHHQEHLTVFTVSVSVHPSCCWLVSWMSWNCICHGWVETAMQFQLIHDTSWQQLGWTLPDTVNTVKCSWWWTKTSSETCRADKKNKLIYTFASCLLL
jgi:hypothetical protein